MPLFNHRNRHRLGCLIAILAGLLSARGAMASLVINEFNQSTLSRNEWAEFLVTTDITLGTLGNFWFGNTNATTSAIQTMTQFDTTEIINSFSYFNSTSDIIKAGTLIVVGGNGVATDFIYNPLYTNPTDSNAWNFTLSQGTGITTNTPFTLNQVTGALWVSSARPMNSTDVSSFVSAVAYLNSTGAMSGGAIADFITTQSLTNGSFQTIHRGVGGGYDGNLASNRSLANTGTGTNVSFGGSESATTTLGVLNGGTNTSSIGELRAVPEPAALIPLSLLALGGFLHWRRQIRHKAATPA